MSDKPSPVFPHPQLVIQIVEATDCRPSEARKALFDLRDREPLVFSDDHPLTFGPSGAGVTFYDHGPVKIEPGGSGGGGTGPGVSYQNRVTGKVVMVAPENDFIPEKPGDWVMLSQTPPMRRITVPAGQTPLEDRPGKPLGHPLLDVFSEGQAAFKNGGGSPYHGHSLEHIVHAWGWVSADLRAALDEAKARIVALEADGRVHGNGTAAARDVLAERHRQVHVERWTLARDDDWTGRQLAKAALCYLEIASLSDEGRAAVKSGPGLENKWPWSWGWWKPTNRRRDLVKAGALIIAEIERLDRLAAKVDEL